MPSSPRLSALVEEHQHCYDDEDDGCYDVKPKLEMFKALANLPSREVLIAQLLGLLQAPATGLCRVLNGPVQGLARCLNGIATKN